MSKKVFIGVGHGGSDSGTVGDIIEKETNLAMALACRDYLTAHGVEGAHEPHQGRGGPHQ